MEGLKPKGFDRRLEYSIDLLRKAEKLALRYDADNGYYLAFSGGKDSQALYHVAQMAGVRFQAHMNLTSVDPPEVIRFVKRQYPDVIRHKPKDSIYHLALLPRNGTMPTRLYRWCCEELKEGGGAGTVCLTGVRKEESVKRSKRNPIEVSDRSFSGDLDGFKEYQKEAIKKRKNINQDQFADQGEQEIRCVEGKDKIIVNPIIEWSEKDVWYFLNEVVKVCHCELYDKGYTRIGCICCPMSRPRQRLREIKEYPHIKRNWMKVICQLRERGKAVSDRYWGEGSEDDICERIFDWWISGKSYKEWYVDTFMQQRLNFDEEDYG